MTAMQTQYLQTSFCTTLTVCVGFVILSSCTTPWCFVGPRGVVRGLPRSFAVLRLCLWHHNPHAIVDWRDGFISPCWRWNCKNDVSESSKIAPTRNWRWFFSLNITWRSQQITVCKNLERLQTSSLFRWKNTLLHYQPTPGGGRRAPKETPPWFSLAILLGTPQFHRRDGKKGQKVSILGAHLRLMSI